MDPYAAGDSGGSSAGGGGNPPHSVRKSPSFMNMPFLKGRNPSSKNTPPPATEPPAEPSQQKRRGPKPDSRPALTRRQELNRQAQRTHRERKEQYIRSLEVQISQLREGYSSDIAKANTNIHQHRQALDEVKDENQALKQILTAHGIPFEAELEQRKSTVQPTSHTSPYSESNPQSVVFSGSGQPQTSTPGTSVSPGRSPMGLGSDPERGQGGTTTLPYQGGPAGYELELGKTSEAHGSVGGGDMVVRDSHGVFENDPQLGIDFILCLEGYCREHMERLCRRAHDDEEQDTPAGHILMASCPPPSYVGTAERGQPYNFRTYDLPHPNLDTLLNLSKQIVTKDEITPIMALEVVKNHGQYHLLTREDITHMMDELVGKVRCYGFGAVLEEFEFMDSLSRLLASKTEPHIGPTTPAPPPPSHPRAIDDAMYS